MYSPRQPMDQKVPCSTIPLEGDAKVAEFQVAYIHGLT